ncbi:MULTISPECIES: KinB signaling pathway activation protein KbaA [Bacillaceae]|uniref:KinB-signaling pathway activation protein n=1 Tax=Bacillus thuringiensis serovar subtoxicus TaxID=475791 RepID=A0A9X6FGU9_BACTU|nr:MULTISPECIES: KinB signaling pathway activation protein KbaA [Bacillus]MCX2704810.1 KinB signaling pathway activation protein KbaA [Bacillus sp. AS_5]MEB4841406.1 KinB signaling pathway activation protein KbaA [Paenibacillus jamilae]KAA0769790.1 KINB signaling pathway activation protein [Bacillus sp. TE8-1]KAB7675868.1 KinB signaling pathway activation protein KbaA [Bacillus sp. B1-WWTP-T-0.5-Post-4]MCR6854874.1 KinB signaling pathway activation protein KbaA [Bacillus thuringiensis]
MNSRKWVRLFLTTLFLGGISTVIIGFVLEWDKYDKFFQNFDGKEILAVSFWLMGVGFIFSVISQMGFFAYLTIHRFGLGMFRSSSLWNAVQLFFIAFVLFDFVYLRSVLIANGEVSLGNNILVAGMLFVFGAIVAYVKSKETNKKAFVPALFFMVVVTILEWVPALRINDTDWLYLMVIPLLLCNAYQLLVLHRLIGKTSKSA